MAKKAIESGSAAVVSFSETADGKAKLATLVEKSRVSDDMLRSELETLVRACFGRHWDYRITSGHLVVGKIDAETGNLMGSVEFFFGYDVDIYTEKEEWYFNANVSTVGDFSISDGGLQVERYIGLGRLLGSKYAEEIEKEVRRWYDTLRALQAEYREARGAYTAACGEA